MASHAFGFGRVLVGALALAALAGCRGETSRETPIFGIRNMYDQPKYLIQEESAFFDDHRTMRPLVEGVVAAHQDVDPETGFGRLGDDSGYVLETPKAVVDRSGGMEAMLARGKERYNVFCTPCHDGTGSGEGLVKRRAVASGAGAFAPPTFHQDRIRHMPDGQLFATITNGKSNMPPYGMQIPVDDRWAIVAYVRALQVAHPTFATPAAPIPTVIPGATSTPAPGGTTANAPLPSTPFEAASGASPTAPSGAPPTTPTGAPGRVMQEELEKKP